MLRVAVTSGGAERGKEKMGIKTKISYCDSTVNPVMGCSGCELYSLVPSKNLCYAADLCKRYAGLKGWPANFNNPEHFPGRLEKAIRWSDLTGKERPGKPWLNGMPRVIFVNDLSDGFCSAVDPWEWLEPHFRSMSESPHIWLLLTKWPDRMVDFFNGQYNGQVPSTFCLGATVTGLKPRTDGRRTRGLLQFTGRRRFQGKLWLSVEPLLGDVVANFAQGSRVDEVDWIVAGGASGRNAPPTHPNHARALRDFAQGWGIPFFWKQWGEWVPTARHFEDGSGAWSQEEWIASDGTFCTDLGPSGMAAMARVGKKAAGRLLDGVFWEQMPEGAK